MKNIAMQMWNEDEGVLTFEWILLVTLLTIGIVGGITAARDAIIDELADVANAMIALDQSYTIDFPLLVQVHAATDSGGSDSQFLDTVPFFDHCERATGLSGQGPVTNCDQPAP